jgi:uncharacterized membrane protein YedE/YeeE
MTTYLPWWLTAISLAFITLGFYYTINRTLGVSGSWTRVVQWKNDKALDEAEASFVKQPKLFEDALMAATIQEFGEAAVTQFMESRSKHKPPAEEQKPVITSRRVHWTVHLVFLFALVLGGSIGAVIKGNIGFQMDLGSVHTDLFGKGFAIIMTLFIGGALVGFGTQLSGGCTSGHGLSGVSRLVPASLIATMSFFGAAIIFSMAIHYLT